MILNKVYLKTKIGDISYLWLDDRGSWKVAALSTSKDWINKYISMLQEDSGPFGKILIGNKSLSALEKDIAEYLDGNLKKFNIKTVFLSGTEFEKRVWREASGVPFGCTCSYGNLADMCERPGAGRAVGNAIGKNPAMLLVPCHRIIKSDESLGGFGSGPELKKKLLALEGTIY